MAELEHAERQAAQHPGYFTPPPRPTFAGIPMASWGYRLGAFVVDASLALIAGFGLGFLLRALSVEKLTATLAGLLMILVVWLLDTVVVVGRTRGQSLGKRLAGTRIVRESGKPVGFGTGFVRDTVCRLLYVVPFVWLVDAFMPLSDERQSLRDKIVKTRVLQEPAYPSRQGPLIASAVVLGVAAIGVVALTAGGRWNTVGGYSAIDRTAFISGCMGEGASESTCGCIFDYMKPRVPYSDYVKADNEDNVEHWPPSARRAINGALSACGLQ